VWVVYRRADSPDEIRTGDIATTSAPVERLVARVPVEDSEVTVDTQAAWKVSGATLEILAAVDGKPPVAPPNFGSPWAGVVRVDLDRVSELTLGTSAVPSVNVRATRVASSGPGTVGAGQPVVAPLSVPASLGGSGLFVRAQLRGTGAVVDVTASTSSGSTTVGKLDLGAGTSTRWTPWIPVLDSTTSVGLVASVSGTVDSALLQIGHLETSTVDPAGLLVSQNSVATYEQIGNGQRIVQLLGPAPASTATRNLRLRVNLLDVGSQSWNPGVIKLYSEPDGGTRQLLWSEEIPRFAEGSLGSAVIDTTGFPLDSSLNPTTGRFYLEVEIDTALDVFVATSSIELRS